jgi:hypothetical protein
VSAAGDPSEQDGTLPFARLDAAVGFRISDYDTPLWSLLNSRAGRWNNAGEAPTQYFALDAWAAWAEIVRFNELHSDAAAASLRTIIWVCRLTSYRLVKYETFADAAARGFPADALVDDDHARCRAQAQLLRAQGVDGIIAPSAALPGSRCVTLFGARVATGWNSDPRLAASIPTISAARGAPPVGLVERVRHYDDSHSGLDAWLAGQEPPPEAPQALF